MSAQAPVTAAPDQFTPVIIRSASLFFRDDAVNSDKEYHAQMVEVAANKFNVSYQYGKRGSNLVSGDRFDCPVGRHQASDNYEELVWSKERKGYRSIKMDELDQIYQHMTRMEMDNAGLDLFMSARGKVIGLADYFRKNKALNQDGSFAFVDSYGASRAIGTMMAGLGLGSSTVDEKQIDRDALFIDHALNNSGLKKASIFLGRQDGESIEPYFSFDQRLMMVPAKKSKLKP